MSAIQGQDDIRTRAERMPLAQIVRLIQHDTEMVYKNNELQARVKELEEALEAIKRGIEDNGNVAPLWTHRECEKALGSKPTDNDADKGEG